MLLLRQLARPVADGSKITNRDILSFQGDKLMRYLIEAFLLFCLIGGAIYANKTMAKESKANKRLGHEPGDAHT